MVLCGYSRRHLVPVARDLAQGTSTTRSIATSRVATITTQSAATRADLPHQSSANKGADHQRHDSWSFFFPDHLSWAQRPPPASRARHPLVKKLISEIYSTSRAPSANRVWKAYTDLKESYDASSTASPSSASTSLLSQLEPAHLQHVLRSIDPSVAKTRKLSRAEGKRRQSLRQQQSFLASGSIPSKILLVEAHNARHSGKIFDAQHPVREYMRRVQIIFRDMRLHSSIVRTTSSAVEALPSLADYNHVLSRLASGGHIGPMSSIWNEIAGASSRSGSVGLQPNIHTYRELMIGLSRHATEQIERVQKGEASKLFDYSGKRRELDRSARAAATGMARFGQVLAPSARAAAILAALRTMALLKDMRDHAVTPNQITLDFAARTLRLAGHIDGIHLLMQQAYGIDLSTLDSADAAQKQQQGPAPTTHTLNTILMALGEQASVPEMVSTFETLAKPLPVKTSDADAAASAEGVFATNWKDIFNSMRNREAEVAQLGNNAEESNIPEVFAPTYPHRICPNTKTFEILLRHCCVEVDPLRSPVALKTESNNSSVATLAREATESALAEMQDGGRRAAEMERRTKGAYALFAKSLLSEALDRSNDLLRVTARNLGISYERVEQTHLATDSAHDTAAEGAVDAADSLPRPEYLRFSVTHGRAMDVDFLPILEPPHFSITDTMVEPFISLASARKNMGELRWIRAMLSKALENKIAEAQMIATAWQVYSARYSKARQLASRQDADSPSASDELQDFAPLQLNDQKPGEIFAFLNRLRQQHRLAHKQAQALEQVLYDKLDERLRGLATARNARQWQRARAHREERLRAEKQRLEDEEREMERKAQAAEARRLRALQKEQQEAQQASTDHARSHIEIASTASA
ncbi:hypothetical protein PHSY_007142 [Pseudozyma hubeiensis SY62]|uniref:Uncharacterized protein n=1 Tax=Pseudozyma hubeiensis (strain SY62) TaxID=1305764 RepID=R9PN36_PSEHS|nr:hypothetical protein PHSY_007142 [Pseudozyma hubeiensis SY62]GAC99540.1 hypothetical protein PHSY_007142 [Pseudozyma hubeiensis SY62]